MSFSAEDNADHQSPASPGTGRSDRTLQALIYTRDQKIAAAFAQAVADLSLDWVLLDDKTLAAQFVTEERFDLLLIDLATHGGPALVKKARSCEANHTSVIFAISPAAADDESLLQLGADVNLKSPADLEHLAGRLGDALPLMKHERRWSRRCPVLLSTCVRRRGNTFPITIVNLSQGGLKALVRDDIPKYDVLRMDLAPPGAPEMHLYGKIVWQGRDYQVGIRFLGLTDEQRHELATWVGAQPEVTIRTSGAATV